MHEIKVKIIADYNRMLSELYKGKTYDYKHILDMISLVQEGRKLPNGKFIASKLIHG